MTFVLLLWACSSPPAPPAPAPAEGEPVGSIGGEPILHRPIVLGGISTEAVVAGVEAHRPAIESCYRAALAADATLSGRVAVRFRIAADGTVTDPRTQATSLRHSPTEACVASALRTAVFTPLATGDVAIVTYPFTFGG